MVSAYPAILFLNRQMYTYNNSVLLKKITRSISTTPVQFASHYDALGLTPKATHSDIKSAYYKLSMLHHPDKSSDSNSALKFRAITEAYEVLGNTNLKKLYDKGLMVGRENTSRMSAQPYTPEPEPTDPTLKFYKSHEFRHITPTMDGRRPIYDFDTWSKQHYGDLLNQTLQEKRSNQLRQEKRRHMEESLRQTYFYTVVTLGALMIAMSLMGQSDYDVDVMAKKNQTDYLKSVENNTNNSIEKN